MMSPKERVLQQIGMWMHRWFGITPNGLSLMRIFCTPWITLLIIETIRTMSAVYAVCALALYVFAILTDLFDGPLARALVAQGTVSHDVGYGGALDRISDKLIIVFSLVPFGFNVFITAIILGESILLYQALHATTTKKKQATYVGKIKMTLQTILMPLLLVSMFIPMHMYFVNGYMGLVVLFTFLSVMSHYKKEVPVQ
jgi:phosphatidylglycerophosphate synthase